jgi:phytoene dehydrogenase-like protein
MPRESIIVIGGGVAGLATGCYAQMNGYRTRIFEMGGQAGGVCASWQRGDYTIDSCIQWLVGTRPGSTFNHVWQELGALTVGTW